jgi:hypothetical protein
MVMGDRRRGTVAAVAAAAAVAAVAVLRALACGALAGCSLITDSFATNDFSGDPFPIHIGREHGAVLVGVREPGGPDLVGVLDVLSPLTLTDPGIDEPPTIGTADLVLLGRRDPAIDAFDVPRAQLRGAQVLSLHPCPESQEEPSCFVGRMDPGQPDGRQSYGAIVGANVLAGDALRLRLGDDQVFVLADVGGDNRDRTYTCDAVFPSPYRGGGTLVIAGTEVSFGGRRVTLQACLGADPDPKRYPVPETDPVTETQISQSSRGGDALLVVSTGIGASLLGETAYERYRQAILLRGPAVPAPPAFEALPEAQVFLPSGLVFGRRASIDRIALAAASSSSPRAPCRQAYAHRLLLERNCDPDDPNDPDDPYDDCPCTNAAFCAVPAVVELEPPGGLEVLVVDDDNATLQALRAELRPDQPEVDGILGADALQLAEIDIDYPHNRVLMRCASPSPACQARPALAEPADRTQVCNCTGGCPAP